MKQQLLTVLGATGSIGASTLDVVQRHPEQFAVFALTAATNVSAMLQLCITHRPQYAVMVDPQAAQQLQASLPADLKTEVLAGSEALTAVSAASQVDQVMAAIVGAAGLPPTLAAVQAGKRVLLANKEALVMSGKLFMDEVIKSGAELLPVDSEHNAIYQCLSATAQRNIGTLSLPQEGISKILLTGSGGPFLELPLAELANQTPQAACKHPNWSMGQKISVDSATMLNKGLEYIEARWLFNCQQNELEVLIHPQSIIHSMVQYTDGSVIAQMGQADMRTPIAHCLHYPARAISGVERLDFTRLSALTFIAPDTQRFPCLRLAQQACWSGQAATTALNAANEIAVEAFLAAQLRFTQIAELCDRVLQSVTPCEFNHIDEIIQFDQQVRVEARRMIKAVA